jgi:hypothetical protein
LYIGESEDLGRRFGQYRNPEPSQRTNVRMNEQIVTALGAGVRVSVATITTASMSIDGGSPRSLKLSRKTSRQIVENAAIAELINQRAVDPAHGSVLMNRPGVGEAEWS